MRPQEPAQSGAAAVSPAVLETLKQRAAECIELSAGRLSALSREIWSRPELAFEEHQAHGALTRFFSCSELPGAAWAVQPHYKLDTAFRAEWGPAAPAPAPRPLHLGFLCEYDALPGIGHACGHNLIAEVGAAAALGVKGALESLPQPFPAAVKITVLGTPAEEGGGGKIELIAAGAFDDLDIVFMAHPAQSDAAYLPDVAEHDVTVKYYGKASHAAAYPWEGVNALDAAVLAYNNISVLRQQMKPTWRVHGIIKNGGVKPNIIPSYTELEFYLRAPSLKDLTILTERAENCFKAAAVATKCKTLKNTPCTPADWMQQIRRKNLGAAKKTCEQRDERQTREQYVCWEAERQDRKESAAFAREATEWMIKVMEDQTEMLKSLISSRSEFEHHCSRCTILCQLHPPLCPHIPFTSQHT